MTACLTSACRELNGTVSCAELLKHTSAPVSLLMFEFTPGGRTLLAVSKAVVFFENRIEERASSVSKCLLKHSISVQYVCTSLTIWYKNVSSPVQDSTVHPTVIMSCVEQTVDTPVPTAWMPPVSRPALRDVSVTMAS